MSTVVETSGLSKKYVIRHEEGHRYTALRDVVMDNLRNLGKHIRHPLTTRSVKAEIEDFWALKDVSFTLNHGDSLGIIGRNGAGKSTLLKLLSRITEPSAGRILIRGRVASLLEVGTGFHPELTGRENIYMNGVILGMSRKEISRKFDEIVDFSGVEVFLDTPVKRYSSGMQARLAFAVAAHLEPDILIVDEVLAVGDAEFQKKCLGKMGDVAKEGRTILFVSHNLAAVESLCNRAIILTNGEISYSGTQTEAIATYMRLLGSNTGILENNKDRPGTGTVRITSIIFKDQDNHILEAGRSGQRFFIHLNYRKHTTESLSNLIVSIIVKTKLGSPIFLHHNRLTRQHFGPLSDIGVFVLELPKLPLPASEYIIGFNIYENGILLDGLSEAVELYVVEGDYFGSGEVPPATHGVCLVEGSWSSGELEQANE
jgi:lipopolysaccharide transport system ATP-binding protein